MGVSKYDGNTWTTYRTTDGLAADYVQALAIDRRGDIWFGTDYGGVSKYDGSTWTTYATAEGLTSNDVTAIAIDGPSRIWFGTCGGGVSEFLPGIAAPCVPLLLLSD